MYVEVLGRVGVSGGGSEDLVLCRVEGGSVGETTLRFTHIYMEVSNRLLRNMVRYLRDSAFVVHYIEFVLMAALRNQF